MNSMWTPESISKPSLPPRGTCSPAESCWAEGWGLVVGSSLLCAGNELSMSQCAASLTLFRDACWGLATSWVCCSRARAMDVLPQPPRTPGQWRDGLGMKLVLKHPMEIVPTESWKDTSGCFMQDEYCQTQSCFTDLVTFPSTLIPPLAVLQALTYLATVFGDFSCVCYLKIMKLFSLMPFLTEKKSC